ncbi:uncharacterized protein [Henckelia pumila]|uniref:uncharacterized protein n=1 Tax=Henckelia pumila TaxID=405737 RepID=UPI003C6E316A
MSGYQKIKRKLRIESLIQSQAGDIGNYFTPSIAESKNVAENLMNEEECIELNDEEEVLESVNMDEMGNNEGVLENSNIEESNFSEKNDEKVQHEILSQLTFFDDPGKWDSIDQKMIDFLVERGPKRDARTLFPKDSTNRHFNVLHYKRILPNGEENDRRCLQKNQTIDAKAQVHLNKEKEHWKLVLHRIISIVQTLAKNNLAFRGSCEKLYVENNGLFLLMVEMIAEFDPIMKEHLRRIKDHETYTTYLGKKIQNELIQMLADEVRKKLLEKVKKAKYFSIILDCTPYISHKEQMSLAIRCLDESGNSTKVKEYWIEFIEVDDTTGLGLFMHLKDSLINLGLDIDDIRVQGYDN